MDNCAGYELNINSDGVSIIYIPPKSTIRHQPLDLGLISASKIRCRIALLEVTIDALRRYNISGSAFESNSRRGKWGLEEGQLLHVANAMKLFNKAWNLTSRQLVIKFWIKSEVIGVNQQKQLRLILNGLTQTDPEVDIYLTGGNWYDHSASLGESETIDSSVVKDIQEAIQTYQSTHQGSSYPITSIIEETIGSAIHSKNSEDLAAVHNIPAFHDNETIRFNVQENELLEMYQKSSCVKLFKPRGDQYGISSFKSTMHGCYRIEKMG